MVRAPAPAYDLRKQEVPTVPHLKDAGVIGPRGPADGGAGLRAGDADSDARDDQLLLDLENLSWCQAEVERGARSGCGQLLTQLIVRHALRIRSAPLREDSGA